MAQAAVGADLLEALDGLGALAPQVAFLREVSLDRLAQLDDLVLGQVAHLAVRLDAHLSQELVGGRAANAVDVGQPNLDALVQRDVDAGDARHA